VGFGCRCASADAESGASGSTVELGCVAEGSGAADTGPAGSAPPPPQAASHRAATAEAASRYFDRNSSSGINTPFPRGATLHRIAMLGEAVPPLDEQWEQSGVGQRPGGRIVAAG
jgi:hypothetical protein